ncbi:uncharacterized protein LOC100909320 [Galendromus occidentalis]|uniref:Uncharacterized protein LOC100909320 n=1 Tax=Galendromus occidentalis TaxID=34638 RepID=A0AAJ6QXY3_9ACAR|nr:uncharacterized protein LOC100909320 [Galendromus occidentalis]
MLRLKIDVTAIDGQHWEGKLRCIFWRLEPHGIPHETVFQYTTHLLSEIGIIGVKPLAYLDGTYIPDDESTSIFRDGDLLRILPAKTHSAPPIPMIGEKNSRRVETAVQNETIRIVRPVESLDDETPTETTMRGEDLTELVSVTANDSECADDADLREIRERKRRKRGKRWSRVRSKRVSFDVIGEGNLRENAEAHMESTPFENRVPSVTNGETPNGTLARTLSDAYVTALADTPGISKQSKKPLKAITARKNKKIQSGVGYYLGLLGSAESSLIAGTSSGDATGSPANGHLKPGPSNCGETSKSSSGDDKRDASVLSTLAPNSRISCDVGMFDARTSSVEHYQDVTLEVLENHKDKKTLFVTHIEGDLPNHVSGSDFKVDWGMLSSIRFL